MLPLLPLHFDRGSSHQFRPCQGPLSDALTSRQHRQLPSLIGCFGCFGCRGCFIPRYRCIRCKKFLPLFHLFVSRTSWRKERISQCCHGATCEGRSLLWRMEAWELRRKLPVEVVAAVAQIMSEKQNQNTTPWGCSSTYKWLRTHIGVISQLMEVITSYHHDSSSTVIQLHPEVLSTAITHYSSHYSTFMDWSGSRKKCLV